MQYLQPNTTLQGGKYRIERVLGQGGFGITYQAEQVSLGRKVAIKEFFMKEYCERDGSTSHVSVPSSGIRELVERFRQKFLREARMIASLNHPNIVKIYDVFEENGTAYYVMEYLPGGSLKQKVEQSGALSERVTVIYTRQIADALEYIHKLKILHLDVKPSNIMLNNLDIAVLVDFGISKHYNSKGEQTSNTPLGISKGFAPWEQYLQGDVNHFTPSTDIYSLGATLYYLVTGAVPPEAPLLNDENLERPTGISNNLWSTIERSMQPRRKDRPQSVESFLKLINNPVAESNNVIQRDKDTFKEYKHNSVFNESTIIENNQHKIVYTKKEIHEYIDLGLSVKWATCNVGATKPEEYGDFYAWGEIATKNEYLFDNYKYKKVGLFGRNKYLKYNAGKSAQLEPIDDVAYALWGDKWRLPTVEEFRELEDKCIWIWTSQNGISGYLIKSNRPGYKNQSIFLPAAGYRYDANLYCVGSDGYYWSGSLLTDDSRNARTIYFNSGRHDTSSSYRRNGLTIRPVCP